MKWAYFAVLLTVLQTTPPVPRQAPDSTTSTGEKVQKKPQQNQTQPASSIPPVNEAAAPTHQNEGNQQGTKNADNSVVVRELPTVTVNPPKRDWVDWGIWGFNGLLVLVGFLQWGVLTKQKKLMGEHAEHLKNLAASASTNALATQDTVNLFINKERARLRVNMKPLRLEIEDGESHTVDFAVSIDGATAAYITESRCVAYIMPLEVIQNPDLCEAVMFPMHSLPNVLVPNSSPSEDWALLELNEDHRGLFISEIKEGRMVVGIRGFIKYRDVFDRDRETRFRYVWKPFGVGYEFGSWQESGAVDENRET